MIFHRGFPEEFSISASDLLLFRQEANVVTPVRRLKLDTMSDHTLGKIAQLPLLSQVVSLEIGRPEKTPGPHQISPDGIRLLAESQHLTGLNRLAIHSHNIGDAGAKVIEESPTFARLTHLTLDDPVFNRGGETRERILTCPNLAGLQELQLGDKLMDAHHVNWLRAGLNANQPDGFNR